MVPTDQSKDALMTTDPSSTESSEEGTIMQTDQSSDALMLTDPSINVSAEASEMIVLKSIQQPSLIRLHNFLETDAVKQRM